MIENVSKIAPRKFLSKSGKTITIRPAETSDAALILEMGKAILHEHVYSLSTPDELNLSPEQEAKWIDNMTTHPSHLLLVGEVDGEIIGLLDFNGGMRKRISHSGYFGMAVSKEYRGEGLGSALLESLIWWAEQHSQIEKVSLKVHADNDRAIQLYQKHGFREEGRLKKGLKYSETSYVDIVEMARFVK